MLALVCCSSKSHETRTASGGSSACIFVSQLRTIQLWRYLVLHGDCYEVSSASPPERAVILVPWNGSRSFLGEGGNFIILEILQGRGSIHIYYMHQDMNLPNLKGKAFLSSQSCLLLKNPLKT